MTQKKIENMKKGKLKTNLKTNNKEIINTKNVLLLKLQIWNLYQYINENKYTYMSICELNFIFEGG